MAIPIVHTLLKMDAVYIVIGMEARVSILNGKRKINHKIVTSKITISI